MENKHKSVWADSVERFKFEKLQGNHKTDVLIIGGGIAGILTAYFLEQHNIDYILVEKGKICDATTQNTTAKITLSHGLIYSKILKSHGVEVAQGYYNANKKAVDIFFSLCKDIDCDFSVQDNFVYSLDSRHKLEQELIAIDKIGGLAEYCGDLKIPLMTAGAVKVRNQAQFNPLKFLFEISKELNIFENTKVLELTNNSAITDSGKITADKIVVATHFPFINKHGSYFLKLYQHRSYVLALENAQDVGGMYIDESNKGLSFRNYNEYLLLGGGGHRTGKKGCAWDTLEKFADKNYPKSIVKYQYATQDCMSLDSMYYIGKYGKSTDNLLVATGFNKWGMTGGMVSAMVLCDMITNGKSEFEEIFNPNRNILTPQLFLNSAEAIKNLLTPTTKRCPHLGCALKWNSFEKSWDCACHGSRFDEKGTVLSGPATDDLKNI